MKKGIELIAAERKRLIEEEGFTTAHDEDEHHYSHGELALAAVCYAAPVLIYRINYWYEDITFTDPWPAAWIDILDKRKRHITGRLIPEKRTKKETILDLTKAGALIAAEIDRLLRL